jgi:uncharacterized protein YkwD
MKFATSFVLPQALAPETANQRWDGDAAQALLDITNQQRASQGIGPLRLNDSLTASATAHSQAMADQDEFAHQVSGEPDLGQRTRDNGYESGFVGENIAAGVDSAQAAADMWFNEPPGNDGHRQNILRREYQDMGVGYVHREGTQFSHYWTVDFGGNG